MGKAKQAGARGTSAQAAAAQTTVDATNDESEPPSTGDILRQIGLSGAAEGMMQVCLVIGRTICQFCGTDMKKKGFIFPEPQLPSEILDYCLRVDSRTLEAIVYKCCYF